MCKIEELMDENSTLDPEQLRVAIDYILAAVSTDVSASEATLIFMEIMQNFEWETK